MSDRRFVAAQRGISLTEAMSYRSAAALPKSTKQTKSKKSLKSLKSQQARGARAKGTDGVPTIALPAAAALSTRQRLRILDGFETVISGVYTHLPLKRARYGFDPVQRLRILRADVKTFNDSDFHRELAAIITQMRDYHTRYTWPEAYAGKVAVLPFLVEMFGPDTQPTYVVTKVGKGLNAAFVPGVALQYWNGVPIDRAVVRHSEHECAGRPDSVRSASLQSLTFRSLEFGPPPDEEWVDVAYRTTNAAGVPTGSLKEIRVPWKVVDPRTVPKSLTPGTLGKRKTLNRTLAVNPAASAVRMAKMLLFAPEALVGEMAREVKRAVSLRASDHSISTATLKTSMPDTLRAQTLRVSGASIGYLRIWGFETDSDEFIAELQRLIPLLPSRGLIIDVRGNPGGYILAAELALQLFTPKRIEPVRFSVLATPFTRDLAALDDELAPWKASLDAAVRSGEIYSQPIPISDPADCNVIGQKYGGPVVLVGDTNTYSAGDLFSAGFVDNGIGPFLCVGEATGAGGANVLDYEELRATVAGSPLALPPLAAGIGFSFAYRRVTRVGPSEGLTVEDVGVAGVPYAMTRNDLLSGNGDLLTHCASLLRKQPLSAMVFAVDKPGKTVTFTLRGLDRVDVFVDGHPTGSFSVAHDGKINVPFVAATRLVEATGYKSDALLQRRRVVLKA